MPVINSPSWFASLRGLNVPYVAPPPPEPPKLVAMAPQQPPPQPPPVLPIPGANVPDPASEEGRKMLRQLQQTVAQILANQQAPPPPPPPPPPPQPDFQVPIPGPLNLLNGIIATGAGAEVLRQAAIESANDITARQKKQQAAIDRASLAETGSAGSLGEVIAAPQPGTPDDLRPLQRAAGLTIGDP